MIFHRRKAHLPKGLRLIVAKHDDILGVEQHHEVIAVSPQGHQPFRTLDIRGQLNLSKKGHAALGRPYYYRLFQ
jgi:hypothetical protein